MPSRIAENELIEPALDCLYDSPNGEASTTELRDYLAKTLSPKGEDTDILDNRNDTKFDQKVRNLKSHKTLEKTGYAERTYKGFRLTNFGKKMVSKRRGL